MKRWGIVARKILLPVISLLCIMFLFVSCSDKSKKNSGLPPHVGMYTNDESSILLKTDGSFVTTLSESNNSKLVFTGKYTLNGENIVFNAEKINGEELGTVLDGKLKDGVITYSGGKPFTKDEDYEIKEEDLAPKEEPKAIVSTGTSTPVPKAENSSSNPTTTDQK
jgi:hypothetical protein